MRLLNLGYAALRLVRRLTDVLELWRFFIDRLHQVPFFVEYTSVQERCLFWRPQKARIRSRFSCDIADR